MPLAFSIEVAVPVFVLSAAILAKGADVFTDGAMGLARVYRISEFLIGTSLVALATSVPELGVSSVASLRGAGEIAFGNVVGSNIANIALVLGMALLIRPILSNWIEMRRDLILMLLAGCVGALVILDKVLQRWEALILTMLYVVCAYVWITGCGKFKSKPRTARGRRGMWLKLLIGALAIYAGAELMIPSAVGICDYFGVTQAAIGLSLVALSTSLPEAAVSAVAARKGAMGIAIGNVAGSNIFNILVVLGVAGTLAPISLSQVSWAKLMTLGIPLMLGLSVLLLGTAKFGRLPRKLAPPLLLCYALFIWFAYL